MFKDQELRAKVDELQYKLKEGLSRIEEQQKKHDESLATLHSVLTQLQNNNTSKFESVDKDLKDIGDIKEEFGKTLRRFQHEQTKSTDAMFNSIKGRVDEHLLSLKKNTQSFKGLEPEVKELMDNFKGLREEINKLTNITKKIKAKDFQMNNFAKTLKESEAEKLRLEQDVANLKRLIGKERRSRR